MIVICRYLIISDLSINGVTSISPTGENERGLMTIGRVTCSFPLGRSGWVPLGEGQDGLSYGGEREGADGSILSNSFLPFGKVRMGLRS